MSLMRALKKILMKKGQESNQAMSKILIIILLRKILTKKWSRLHLRSLKQAQINHSQKKVKGLNNLNNLMKKWKLRFLIRARCLIRIKNLRESNRTKMGKC